MRLSHRSVLDAYREDLLRAGTNKKEFGDADSVWILVAAGVHRLATTDAKVELAGKLAESLASLCTAAEGDAISPPLVEKLRALSDALRVLDLGRESTDRVVAELRSIEEDIEEAGALCLASAVLSDVTRIAEHASPIEQGHVLLQQARVTRTLGDLDIAVEFYGAAANLGRRYALAPLRARALIGAGVVARIRGNYPSARTAFQKALAVARAADLENLVVSAHQGLMITAATAHDYDTALVHGWEALSSPAVDARQRADLLGNLAEVCWRSGYPRAALHGYLQVVQNAEVPRMRLPSLGGAALAAAQLGDRQLLEEIAASIIRERSGAFPYESARALEALARALLDVGETDRAAAAMREARSLARAGGFFEVVYALDQIDKRTYERSPVARTLSGPSLNVVESMDRLGAAEDPRLAISGISTG
jgi:tetratricopeptide (TPR) repeat protein